MLIVWFTGPDVFSRIASIANETIRRRREMDDGLRRSPVEVSIITVRAVFVELVQVVCLGGLAHLSENNGPRPGSDLLEEDGTAVVRCFR